MTSPCFPVRGIVEGFYGVFYTPAERMGLIRFAGARGLNFYMHAPKDDRYHRLQWRAPYPARTLAALRETVGVAAANGVTFCYAIHPGLSISYASADDFQAVVGKLKAFYDSGVRAFSLLLDDIASDFAFAADRQRYTSYAEAHADLCNRTYEWLQALDPGCTLSMCPTDYHGSAPYSAYVHTLGAALHPAIDVFYTGPQVCSHTLTAADASAFAEAIGRPPLIWDNYPVNDGGMQAELHIGPLRGRDPLLYRAVKGVLVNPMNQAEASKVALATYAAYLDDPHNYDADHAWEDALRDVAGDAGFGALRILAENSLESCLSTRSAERLHTLTGAALAALARGERLDESAEVGDLGRYLAALDDACYGLTYEIDNAALRNELRPWIELLDTWRRLAQHALHVLFALEREEPATHALQRVNDLLAAVQAHPKRIGGDALLPLAHLAQERAQTRFPSPG